MKVLLHDLSQEEKRNEYQISIQEVKCLGEVNE